MADYGRETDSYGNPVHRQVDEFSNNSITHPQGQQQTGTTGGYGTTNTTGTHAPGTGAGIGHQQRGLRRSGSSSSSSSDEDDGQGGRRKKGLKDKIKDKLPGGGKKTDQGHITTPTPGGGTTIGGTHTTGYGTGTGTGGYAGQTEQDHEKKGIMEKIKEKLPGQNKGSTTY